MLPSHGKDLRMQVPARRSSGHRQPAGRIAARSLVVDKDKLLGELFDVVFNLLELTLVRLLALLLGGRVEGEGQGLVLLVHPLPVGLEAREESVPLLLGEHLNVVFVLRVLVLLHLLDHSVLLCNLLLHAVNVLGNLPIIRLLEVVDLVRDGPLGHREDVVHRVCRDEILLRHEPHDRLLVPVRDRGLHRRGVPPADSHGDGVAEGWNGGLPLLQVLLGIHMCVGLAKGGGRLLGVGGRLVEVGPVERLLGGGDVGLGDKAVYAFLHLVLALALAGSESPAELNSSLFLLHPQPSKRLGLLTLRIPLYSRPRLSARRYLSGKRCYATNTLVVSTRPISVPGR
mmetsp:Transcript_47007/g.114242  ORF Transcript_47007/g.114242 Transcript_47007/m.114242 type:complete len:342 (-) Transcript_47007:13-1038(-)